MNIRAGERPGPHPGEDREYGIAPPGHRLPDATRPGRVVLQVADLNRSLRFYEEVLGLRVLGRSAAAATLAAHQDDRPLLELREHESAAPVPVRGRIGLYHFAILMPERAALGRFVRNLAEQGLQVGASDHLVSEALYLHDPDGLGIEVYVDRPRSSWRHSGRQLQMATAPLDVRDLAEAGGAEPWRGMPEGTRIGHVHLHVGDIEEASRFYHAGLGFDQVVWSYPGALFLSAGGYHHHLGVNTWAAGAPIASEGDARLLEWEIELPTRADVETATRSLEKSGYPVERVDTRSTLARDPWMIQLRLTAGTEGAPVELRYPAAHEHRSCPAHSATAHIGCASTPGLAPDLSASTGVTSVKLIHDQAAQRFRLPIEGGGEAYVQYAERDPGTLDLQHTAVPSEARGRGVGSELIEQVLTHARDEDLRIVASCPFVAAYIKDHPEYQTLIV